MTDKEWYEDKEVPNGVWIQGMYLDPAYPFFREVCPILRQDQYYWLVRIHPVDGGPSMARLDKPPALWRCV